jgi:hypothetical protein
MKTFKFFQEPKPIRWVTGYGSTVLIENISIDHMRSIIRCMNGEGDMIIPNPYCGNSHMEWIIIFHNELNRRRNQTTISEVES